MSSIFGLWRSTRAVKGLSEKPGLCPDIQAVLVYACMILLRFFFSDLGVLRGIIRGDAYIKTYEPSYMSWKK